jgi:hypothetical protein
MDNKDADEHLEIPSHAHAIFLCAMCYAVLSREDNDSEMKSRSKGSSFLKRKNRGSRLGWRSATG